jgi:hypothetical protein
VSNNTQTQMDERELQELFKFVTGQGRWAWTGPYMHTHSDSKNDIVHAGCIELERRGLLKRHTDEPGHVCWVATDSAALKPPLTTTPPTLTPSD